MRRPFLIELDVPDGLTDAEAVDELYERVVVGQGADHEHVGVQVLHPNAAVFAGSNSVILMLPIMNDPPKAPVAMTIHTEPPQNWIQPGVGRVNVLGYLAVDADMFLPTDEGEG